MLRHPRRSPILEPGRLGVVGHVGLGGPVVRARGVEGQGPVEALPVGQFAGPVPQVPLAGHQGPVAFALQPLGEGQDLGLDPQAVAPLAPHLGRKDLFDGRRPGPVVVQAGQEHGPGGRAQGRGAVAGEHGTLARHPVDVGGPGLAAVGAQVHQRQVIEQDQDDVRPACAGDCGRRRRCSHRPAGTSAQDRERARRCGSPQGPRPPGSRVLHRGLLPRSFDT